MPRRGIKLAFLSVRAGEGQGQLFHLQDQLFHTAQVRGEVSSVQPSDTNMSLVRPD